MYKKIIVFVISCCIVMSTFGCSKAKDSSLTTVRLNEVAHSIFYAPQYVAIELGYFEDEGIDLILETGFGADKTMTAVISGNADIGFMGSESTIYAYAQGATDYAVNFAQLTQRAGNFIVSREKIDYFTYEDLIGKTVLGGRAGGMPEMVFEYILKQKGIDKSTIDIVQNIDFGLTAGAFSSGQGDFTIEFEPGATSLELENAGYVVSSLGVESGYVPYTAYSAKKSYIDNNEDLITHFINAIEKGMSYVDTHDAKDIATVIAPQFPDSDIDTIAIIVDRYKAQDTWKTDSTFEEDAFNLLCDILIEAGELEEKVSYSDLVITPKKH